MKELREKILKIIRKLHHIEGQSFSLSDKDWVSFYGDKISDDVQIELIEQLLLERDKEVREDNTIYLFADNFLKQWGNTVDAKKDYEHIERTRKTRKQALREVKLLLGWFEKSQSRIIKAMNIIKKLSSGEKVSVEELKTLKKE